MTCYKLPLVIKIRPPHPTVGQAWSISPLKAFNAWRVWSGLKWLEENIPKISTKTYADTYEIAGGGQAAAATTCYYLLLLVTTCYYLLLTTCCYLLLVTYYLLLTTCYLLLVAYYLLLTTCCFLTTNKAHTKIFEFIMFSVSSHL